MKKVLLILFIVPLFAACGDDDDSSSSKRCIAITKDGTQCKRNAEKGSSYCWQHKK